MPAPAYMQAAEMLQHKESVGITSRIEAKDRSNEIVIFLQIISWLQYSTTMHIFLILCRPTVHALLTQCVMAVVLASMLMYVSQCSCHKEQVNTEIFLNWKKVILWLKSSHKQRFQSWVNPALLFQRQRSTCGLKGSKWGITYSLFRTLWSFTTSSGFF